MSQQAAYPGDWFPTEHKTTDPQSRAAELLRYCGDFPFLPTSRYSPTGTNRNPYAVMHTNRHVCAQAIN